LTVPCVGAGSHARPKGENMKNKILELEKSLFKVEYMSDYNCLDNIIADDFKECGKSGYMFDKKGTIEFLLSVKEDRKIDIYNFECEEITEESWLVHYITKNDTGELIYRTSIWVMKENLKLLYHQASVLKEEIKLKLS